MMLKALALTAIIPLSSLLLLGACARDEGAPFTAAQCRQFDACDTETACASAECVSVAGCDNAICIATDEACDQLCGSRECNVLESSPAQIACQGGKSPEGDTRSCEDVKGDFAAELALVQSCTEAADCGQVIEASSCGCTRSLVARLDADVSKLESLMTETVDGALCLTLGSTCDCPEADGFACVEGRCGWNYLEGS